MTLLKNATVVRLHPPQVLEGTDILIDGAEIAVLSSAAFLRYL